MKHIGAYLGQFLLLDQAGFLGRDGADTRSCGLGGPGEWVCVSLMFLKCSCVDRWDCDVVCRLSSVVVVVVVVLFL